jgi:hypothetical protein
VNWNAMGWFDVLGLLVTLTLLALLILKELIAAAGSLRTRKIERILNIAIVPLLIGFVLIAAMKIADVLH